MCDWHPGWGVNPNYNPYIPHFASFLAASSPKVHQKYYPQNIPQTRHPHLPVLYIFEGTCELPGKPIYHVTRLDTWWTKYIAQMLHVRNVYLHVPTKNPWYMWVDIPYIEHLGIGNWKMTETLFSFRLFFLKTSQQSWVCFFWWYLPAPLRFRRSGRPAPQRKGSRAANFFVNKIWRASVDGYLDVHGT